MFDPSGDLKSETAIVLKEKKRKEKQISLPPRGLCSTAIRRRRKGNTFS